MSPGEGIKETPIYKKIITAVAISTVCGIALFLISIPLVKWGLGYSLFSINRPRPHLLATVSCENWKKPWCVGEGIKRKESKVEHYGIQKVLDANSMYIIKLENTSDCMTAKDVSAVIEGNLYAEVTKKIGDSKKSEPKEHFQEDEFIVGPIYPEKTFEIKAWMNSEPSRHFAAKHIEISGRNAVASIYVEKPVRTIIWCLDKFLWEVIFLLIIFVLFLFRSVIRELITHIRKNFW